MPTEGFYSYVSAYSVETFFSAENNWHQRKIQVDSGRGCTFSETRPVVLSKYRRPRNTRKTAPGGQRKLLQRARTYVYRPS